MKHRNDTNRKAKHADRGAEEQSQPHMISPERLSPAEGAYFQKQEKYRLLAESSPLGIAVVSRRGRYQYLNPKFVDLFGYTLADIPTGQEWFAKAFPDRSRRRQLISDWKLYLQESQAGEAEPRNFTVTCKDGSAKVIKFRAVPLEGGEQFILYEDITALREAENARREAEELFRVLYECAADAFFLHDNGEILEVNQQSCDSLGYSREELLAMEVVDIEVGISPEELEALWRQPLFQPRTILGRQRRKDGSTFPVEVRARVFDYRGRKLRLSLVRDISERLQTEAALKESELKYRSLVEQSPAITFICPLTNLTTPAYVSPQVDSILGFSPADFEADPDLWVKQLHPEDRDWVLAEVVRCQNTGEPFDCEYRIKTKDGRTVWFQDKARVVQDSSERYLFLQGVSLDITERKRAEGELLRAKEEWERTFDAISDLVMILDDQYRIIRVNRAAAHRLGYTPEEMVGKCCHQALYGLEAPCSHCHYASLLVNGKAVKIELWDEKLQGHFLITMSPIYDPSGKIVGSVQVGTDITERKRAEEALRKSEERYRLIAENVSDVIWTADLDLKTTYVSPSVQQLLGYTPDEMMGRPLGEFLPPASLGKALEVLSQELDREKQPQSAAELNRSRLLELEQHHKKGHKVWTEIKARFLRDSENRSVGILGVDRDITERKQAEKALRRREAILEAVSFGAEKFLKTRFWEHDIQEVLARLGQAVQVSRIYIFENHTDKEGNLLASLRHEWVGPDIAPQIDNPEHQNTSYKPGFERWEEVLPQGQIIWGPVTQFPPSEQALLAARDTKSIVAVPIFVGQQWWGDISFEDCFQERKWSSMEVDALLTAGSILGLTILHQQEEESLRESEEKLRSLSYQLLNAQEQERKRLASELHNVLGHDLLVLKLKLESLREELGPEQIAQDREVQHVLRALQDSVRNVRLLCQDLTPGELEDLGLTTALHRLVENFAVAQKLTWQTEMDNLDGLFEIPVQTTIYRLVQEALTNIGKHAQAKNLWLQGRRNGDEVAFVIEDDGQGFNVAKALAGKKTLGLLTMKERLNFLGGTFDIVSREQAGTKIIFTIPVFKRGDLQ